MSSRLSIDWCSYQAARYAVENWHYSRTMPLGKIVKLGVWEDGSFIGAVLFARGNSPALGKAYGLAQPNICELVRVALADHKAPVSRIVPIAVKMLKKQSPELRLIVSFADPYHGHVGTIYQAMNWVYTGETASAKQFWHDGKWKHTREVTGGAFGGEHRYKGYKQLPTRLVPAKHRYLWPLDKKMREQVLPLAKPYPKKVTIHREAFAPVV